MMRHAHAFALLAAVAAAACSGSATPIAEDDALLQSKAATPPALAEYNDDAPGPADGNGTGVVQPQARPSSIDGTVEGMTLNPQYSFFLQGVVRVGDVEPTVILVLTDTPRLCAHINQGTTPKNTTLLAMAVVQTDGKPVHTGYAYTAPGHHGVDALPRSMSFFRQLDANCEINPGESGAQAMYGQVVLRELVDFEHAVADFSLEFEEGDAVTGHVDATFCDAPNFFADPERFLTGDPASACLDD